jgi:hypothetical protein
MRMKRPVNRRKLTIAPGFPNRQKDLVKAATAVFYQGVPGV